MHVENQIIFRPVGAVRTSASDDDVKETREEFESIVEIFPEFEDRPGHLQGQGDNDHPQS